MKKCTLFLCLLLSCASLTSATYGAERVEDFFYPDGRSSFAIFRADTTEPVGQASVLFERTSKGGRLTEDRQMRLDESAKDLS